MLKRFMPALISLILLLAVSNNALAVFADLELIRVYYDRSGSEIATDLGNVKTILSSGSTQTYAGSFGSPSLTNGYAAYFALSSATGELWATNVNITGATFTPVIIGGGTGLTSIKSGTTNMYSTYNLKGGTNYTGLASVINSYKNKISATQGWFANTITAANSARSYSELSLNALGASNTQTLYYWANGLATTPSAKAGVAVAQITTNADGSTTISRISTRTDGTCDPKSDNQPLTAVPTANLCSGGIPSTPTGIGPWSWVCSGKGVDLSGVIATNADCKTAQIFDINVAVNGGNGTIICTSPVGQGSDSTCTITPDPGYQLETFTDDGANALSAVKGNSYTITNVQAAHTIVGTFIVNQITPLITWNNPADITYGTPLSEKQFNAIATDPVTSATVPGSFAYSRTVGTILSAGSAQSLSVIFSPTDALNYTTATAPVSINVNQAPLIVTADAISKVYGTKVDPTLTYTYSGLVNNDSSSVITGAPVRAAGENAGKYAITQGTLAVGSNYSLIFKGADFSITPAPLTVTADNLSKTVGTANPPLTVTYKGFISPETAADLTTRPTATTTADASSPAGQYPITVSGGVSNNYEFTYVDGTLTVTSKLVPVINWQTPAAITYGTTLSGTELNATASDPDTKANLPGTFTYNPPAGTLLTAGVSQALSVTFTPQNSATYTSVTTSVNLTVNRANQAAVTLTSPATATYGQSGLSVVASGGSGTGSYSYSSGTSNDCSIDTAQGALTISSGTGTCSITATRAGDSNYNVSATSAAASIQISKATQTIIFPDLPAKTYKDADFAPGATASSRLTVTYASSNLAVATIVNGQIHIVGAGSADITVSQSGDANYGPATEVVKSLKVNQLTPVINWATPSAINSITPLSATQLNAIATIAGNFIYTPASGTVLNAGTQILSVTFTPTDNVNYSSASKPVNLTVTQWYPTGSLSGGATPNITDALRVMRSTVGLETLTAVEQRNADVAPLIGGKPSPNGKIDAGDALIILKLVVGIIPAW